MLNTLRSCSEKKTKNAREVITFFHSQNMPGIISDKSPVVINKHTRKYEYIILKHAIENLSKSSERHLNEKKFLDKSDRETQLFIDEIQKEIAKYIPLSSIKDIKLRGRKDKSFTAWLLHEDSEPLTIDESFLENASCYADPKVTAVTLLNSAEEERGLRISLDKNKCRLYEVVNGFYQIKFHWSVGNKHRSIAMNIGSNGTVICDNPSEDLTFEDLEENKQAEIRIGNVKNKKMTLAELVSLDELLYKRFSEEVKPLSQGNSKIENHMKKNAEEKSLHTEVESQLSQPETSVQDVSKVQHRNSAVQTQLGSE